MAGPLSAAQDFTPLVDGYIEAWRDFYPTRAFAYGDADSAPAFEDYRGDRVERWLDTNRETAAAIDTALDGEVAPEPRADLRVLLAQVERELAAWREDAPLTHQPQWYAEQVSQALTHLLVREQLEAGARSAAAIVRLQGVQRLCNSGVELLVGGKAQRTERALRVLGGSREFLASGLAEVVADWPPGPDGRLVEEQITATVAAVEALERHLREEVLPAAAAEVSIGADVYAARLSRRTLGSYTPQRLRAAAAEELQGTRALMLDEAARWRRALGDESLPAEGSEELLAAALEAMENDRQDNAAEFLREFRALTADAERFVNEHAIASVPQPTTLYVALSPAHFSGAAVGGVYPSGAFDPQANTLFYVPSIPDSAPAAARDGFYRSFNTHFNTMILSHEMFPGHYLQYKVAVTEAPRLRSLFPNGSYVEGWGSFAEELMLDAGWADDAPLTRLAHLRKRLENATRAYVSVQVSTAGWDEEKVLRFARDEGMLAPQFATNLWQRVVNSPLQITDYMTGSLHFRRLYAAYRAQGDGADVRRWVDAVLRVGPLPMPLLEAELRRMGLAPAADTLESMGGNS